MKSLAPEIDEGQLRADFGKFGILVDVRLTVGVATVEYGRHADAAEAVRIMDGARYFGRALIVSWLPPPPLPTTIKARASGPDVRLQVEAPQDPIARRVIDSVAVRVMELGARFEQQLLASAPHHVPLIPLQSFLSSQPFLGPPGLFGSS